MDSIANSIRSTHKVGLCPDWIVEDATYRLPDLDMDNAAIAQENSVLLSHLHHRNPNEGRYP